MQFRTQGNRIQILAYRGYNKEKKRADVKLLGSFDRYALKPTDELLAKLTDDEKSELQSHMSSIRLKRNDAVRQSDVNTLAGHIERVSDCLNDEQSALGMTAEMAADLLTAMDGLTKQLRRLGHRRTTKPPTVA